MKLHVPKWQGLAAVMALSGFWVLAQADAVKTNTVPANTNTPAAKAEAFRLGPQDRLTYYLEDDPIKGAAPDEVVVNALGNASFRVTRGSDLSITLQVSGKTLAEVVQELKAKLDADYYQNVRIKLDLKETTPRFGQVLFIGRGTRGSMLQLAAGEEKRIFEAVHQVGVNEWANLKKVKLMRVNPTTQKTDIKIIDLEEIKKGNRANNVILQSGDIIEVPEKWFNLTD